MQFCIVLIYFFLIRKAFVPEIFISLFMRKFIFFVIISLLTTLFFCQCNGRKAGDNGGYGEEYPQTKESMTIIDNCMSFMQTDPARSHQIIDSVCNAKLMSPQRCDYYHAMVVYEGEENRDSALTICNRLLDEGKFGDDKFLEEEICVLASNIAISVNRYLETLQYANRGIAICHGQELMNYDEAMLMGRAGQAELSLGRTEEARQTYAKANKLLLEDKTFGGLIARISLMMKQSMLYSITEEYDSVIAICHEVLDLVHRFDRDPFFVEPRPETMKVSGDATREFADFYESQMYSKIAHAYYNIASKGSDGVSLPLVGESEGVIDSLNHYLDKWKQTKSHTSPVNLANTMRELYFTGRMADFNEAKAAVADLYKGDSILSDYVDYLSLLAEEAASRSDYKQSNDYLQRALAISDSIRQQETLRMLSEQMSINMVQQQQLARQEAENDAARYKLIIVIIAIIVALGSVITILRRRNKEKEEMLQMTQQDLMETREEVNDFIQQLEEVKQEKQSKDLQELYDSIERVFREKQLYLNPDLSVIMLAEELNTNRTFISTCINTITGKSFRTWLAEYRLNLFLEKQNENPDSPIDKLLTQCGYKDQSTFRRQFKATFGMTPSEYRKANP